MANYSLYYVDSKGQMPLIEADTIDELQAYAEEHEEDATIEWSPRDGGYIGSLSNDDESFYLIEQEI